MKEEGERARDDSVAIGLDPLPVQRHILLSEGCSRLRPSDPTPTRGRRGRLLGRPGMIIQPTRRHAWEREVGAPSMLLPETPGTIGRWCQPSVRSVIAPARRPSYNAYRSVEPMQCETDQEQQMSNPLGKITAGEDLLGKIRNFLSGFVGYVKRENRREADKSLRSTIASRWEEQWGRISQIQREMVSAGQLEFVDDLEAAAIRNLVALSQGAIDTYDRRDEVILQS